MERVSVYIDGANFFCGIKSINEKYSDFYFDFEKYIKKITSGKKLVDVYYFNAPLKQQCNPVTYRKQQLQFSRLKRAGYNVILCKRKKRVDDNGDEKNQIKEDDIRIALQIQKDSYMNKFDVAYLFSGDGDFAPIQEYISEKGKKIKVFYFKNRTSPALLRACDYRCEIIDRKIINRYFCRDAYTQWQNIINSP